MNSNNIAVDYDGTITNEDGSVNELAVSYLQKISQLGYQLILWTARKDDRYKYALNHCLNVGLDIKEPSEQGKITAFYYIDDRSVPGGKINWKKTYKYLKKYKS
jgi:hypothetical protein